MQTTTEIMLLMKALNGKIDVFLYKWIAGFKMFFPQFRLLVYNKSGRLTEAFMNYKYIYEKF